MSSLLLFIYSSGQSLAMLTGALSEILVIKLKKCVDISWLLLAPGPVSASRDPASETPE